MSKNYAAVFLGLVTLFSFLLVGRSVTALTLMPSDVSVGAIVTGLPIIDTGGGSGGGGAQSGVRFSGFAYPDATVIVQNALNVITSVLADDRGKFSIVVPDSGVQFFTLVAIDRDGRRSTLINFPTILYNGHLTDISGIRFAPTIVTDKLAVKEGNYLTVSGSAVPDIPLQITIEGFFQNTTFTLSAHADGRYSITVPITLPEGEYTVKIGYVGDERVSRLVRLVVGSSDIYAVEATSNIPGDCNFDEKVTLADFSILAYWYGKKNPPRCVDLNKDGAITLIDFSILAFYWNG